MSATAVLSMPEGNTPRLRRVLTLWDLIFYGIVAVTPSAPATIFGLADVQSRGHVVLTILAAMAAMVLTAISYGRMAALYPSAGSAYTYVGRGIHPYLGFVAGWAMLLDYMLIPLFSVIQDNEQYSRSVFGGHSNRFHASRRTRGRENFSRHAVVQHAFADKAAQSRFMPTAPERHQTDFSRGLRYGARDNVGSDELYLAGKCERQAFQQFDRQVFGIVNKFLHSHR